MLGQHWPSSECYSGFGTSDSLCPTRQGLAHMNAGSRCGAVWEQAQGLLPYPDALSLGFCDTLSCV